MSQLKTYRGGDQIGSIKSIDGCSTALNTQKGWGGQKPSVKGNANPGDTNPGRDHSETVPMP